MATAINHRFCIAPMMDWTDRHERYFLRLLTSRALLYTEMVTSAALIHGDAQRFLRHCEEEHPLAIQLGGSDPRELAVAATMAEKAGFDEINLNIGCPSDRVQSGAFGACLMARPALVAECVSRIRESVNIPVTVKCRIGIDDRDSEQELIDFVQCVAAAGCQLFIIHARKAILKGLSPKENREIPPLNYSRVFRIKQLFPELEVVINGGIDTLEQALNLLQQVDGVMLGREAYQNPYILQRVDSEIYGDPVRALSRHDLMELFIPYIETEIQQGTALHHMTRHILGLFKGVSGGRQFRRHLSEQGNSRSADIKVLTDALALVTAN